ncbi:MAG: OsmC family peroxiredoxin [Hyphomicrobiales bacterium]|nr:MAG: OsmC family peroxiredoxin [Hyphomicrobiales bacterium]
MSNDAPVLTSCLAPISKDGLDALIAAGKANPAAIKTVRCRTVAEGRFRHLNFIRNLPPHIVDEPPGLLGDDTAPNPSEALLAALGSCLAVGIHANAVAQGIAVRSLALDLEADINITSVWGTGDTSPKPVGFEGIRVRVTLDADAPKETLDALIAHAQKWSPVANTIAKPVALTVTGAEKGGA